VENGYRAIDEEKIADTMKIAWAMPAPLHCPLHSA